MTRSPLLSASLIALLAASTPVRAEPVTLLDLVSLDRLATIGVQWGVTALRSVAEVRFVDMAVEPLQGRLMLTGLEMTPYGSACTIGLDRAVITSAPLNQTKRSAIDIDFVGLSLNQGCLEEADMRDLAAFGITELNFDHGRIGFDYVFASGGASLDIDAVSPGLAELRASASFAYFGVNADTEEPVADLASAEIEIRNLGLMAALAPMIPPQAADPQALSALLQGAILGEVSAPGGAGAEDGFGEPGGKTGGKIGGKEGAEAPREAPAPAPAPQPDALAGLIDDSAGAISAFLAEPDRLVLRLAPPEPVRLSEDLLGDFAAAAAALAPELSADPAPRVAVVTKADIAALDAALAAGTQPDEALALRSARAFLTGIGAPRDARRGMAILAPLLEAGNPEATAIALAHLDALAPADAYRIARTAAAKGNRAAFARLDGIERRLGLADAIALQEADGPRSPAAPQASAAELRDRAFAALTGLGAPRRYTSAYYDGLLALAAGDTSAAPIVDTVEALAGQMDAAGAEDWAATLETIRTEATTAWLARE